MTDLSYLLDARQQLASRLEKIETAWADIVQSVATADEEIERAKRARMEMVKRGKRIRALLMETRQALEQHDALIKSAVDSIADHHIGEREGAYLIPGGMVIARTRINGTLYTAFVELLDSS